MCQSFLGFCQNSWGWTSPPSSVLYGAVRRDWQPRRLTSCIWIRQDSQLGVTKNLKKKTWNIISMHASYKFLSLSAKMLFWCICACYCHDKLEKCLKYFLKGVLQDSNSTQLKKQLMHNIPSGNKLPVIKAVAKLWMAPNWMKKRERNKRRPWLLLRGWGFYNRCKRGHSQRQRPLEESRPLVN